jgi:YggT family protein
VVLATSVRWFAGYPFDLIMLMALHRFLQWILYGFMILLVIEAIFSWVNPHAPLAPFVRALNEPILKPVRRVVPLVGNLDLSLLVALVLLQIAQIVLEMLFR